jgi:hypothetical protein
MIVWQSTSTVDTRELYWPRPPSSPGPFLFLAGRYSFLTTSGSLATLAAIRRASSLISGLAEGLRRNSFRCATVLFLLRRTRTCL